MLWRHRGLRLHYDLLGPARGPVVCLLHSLAADGGMWAEQLGPLLAAGYRVLRPDARGHGGSQAGAGPVAMAELADDVAALIERLALPPLHLVGLSLGGMTAQGLALARPELLRSLVLCDTLAASPAGSDEVWERRLAAIAAAGSLVPLAEETLARWLTPAFRAAHPDRTAAVLETIVATDPAGYAAAVAALRDFDYRARLPAVALPTLLLYGADDPSTPAAAGRELQALIAGSRFHALDGGLHLPNIECFERFNTLLLDWLARHR